MAEFITQSRAGATLGLSRFMNRVYGWMSFGLFVSALTAFFVTSSQTLITTILTHQILFFGLIIAQFGLVIWLSAKIQTLSVTASRGLFLLYTALTGVTFAVILMAFTKESIMMTFVITAGSFAGLSLFGYVTKRDLGPIGSFCMMGLWGLIIISLIAMFVPSMRSHSMQLLYGVVGVIVFAGLTAYDTQKIKSIYLQQQMSEKAESKSAIMGALTLYLDFINLFLSLLYLFGDRR